MGAAVAQASRHDVWQSGDSYDNYIGRWSRLVAPRFLDWLDPDSDLDWLEVGCGTGALTDTIVTHASPRTMLCIDSSETFLEKARADIADPRVEFRLGDAQALSVAPETRDIVVSGLVLNFIPDRTLALREMLRVVRPRGMVAFYVWDYPDGGMEFMRAFWTAATALDEAARDLGEGTRFPFCNREDLLELAGEAGLAKAEAIRIEIPTLFKTFDDFWHPFTLGTGPAPGYCASLDPAARDRLKETLRADLPFSGDGSIPLKARAWAIRGRRH